ncbi:M61 family metallopeptidase [Cyclobacterium plantarum]|uniref:M61 family peptidase n=1 Tax=Cyclobacterium plantarum TaxID=2716263 RepID=A0ABX0HCP0_9BACT|nr:M61 family peptidase [Cyclobacterium plantarum]NHE59484.1 M61 family peptidase [Cyclobacterium plantarum]
MIYSLSVPNPASQLLNIQLELNCEKGENLALQLPSWRPGRYEIANYAQFLKNLNVTGPEGQVLCHKRTKDLWDFQAQEKGIYKVSYSYHAAQMDAGGSWTDAEQVYVNFINLAFEIEGREAESIEVKMDLPEEYLLACALPQPQKHLLLAQNFQELVDSPLIASADLQHRSYTVKDSTFHLWISGKIYFDWDILLNQFEKFTEKQIADFGEFPAENYHFLIHLLPFPHYHGVEHQYSTVITIGPDEAMGQKSGMDRLIGVCSHELYHFWNVCRIRPKAIQPYDFSKEAYLSEGMVAEGVTTFMGDYYLLKSGYFSISEYLESLEKLFERGFENLGWENQSITESSWDLWLDGYKAGVPDKKVSIYTHGALLTLALDLILMKGGHRMHEVMKAMWTNFGTSHKGYTLKDFKAIVVSFAQHPEVISSFFDRFVFGKEDLLPTLVSLLPAIGLEMKQIPKENKMESEFGLKINKKGQILKIHPKSLAYHHLMTGDRIISYQIKENGLHVTFERWKKENVTFLPTSDETSFYMDYKLVLTGQSAAFSQFIDS